MRLSKGELAIWTLLRWGQSGLIPPVVKLSINLGYGLDSKSTVYQGFCVLDHTLNVYPVPLPRLDSFFSIPALALGTLELINARFISVGGRDGERRAAADY